MMEMGFTKISTIQQYWLSWNIRLIMDPASNPYHIGDYDYPLYDSSGKHFTSWAAWQGAYMSTYNAAALFSGRASDATFGYPMIGAVGLSYAAGQTAGGYSGSAAYTWIQNAIGPTNLALQNDNPMWAIVPRVAIPVQPPSCDLDGNGTVDNNDVQISISRALGQGFCGGGDLDGDGRCTVIDVQRVINAAGGGMCRIGP
jgi:hypothetical protein